MCAIQHKKGIRKVILKGKKWNCRKGGPKEHVQPPHQSRARHFENLA